MIEKEQKSVFFIGLNGLRFLAAFAVFVTHVELLKMMFGLKHNWYHPIVFNLGGWGVSFFFVLSGFLITYLLLSEKKHTNTVQIKHFYIRRILRIWPLYYLILILGFFILPKFNDIYTNFARIIFEKSFYQQLMLYVIILPNVAYSFFGPFPHIGQSWSIGVEEQFYLIWPVLIKKVKNIYRLCFGSLVTIGFFKICFWIYYNSYSIHSEFLDSLKTLIVMSKFENMCIGAISACILFDETKWNKYKSYIVNPIIHLTAWILIPINIYWMPKTLQDGLHIVDAVLFVVIILNVINTNSLISKILNFRGLNSLGKISYGIYMYHFMIIPIVLIFFKKTFSSNYNWFLTNLLIYSASFLLTILISTLSYTFFEKKILKYKSNYSQINSGAL